MVTAEFRVGLQVCMPDVPGFPNSVLTPLLGFTQALQALGPPVMFSVWLLASRLPLSSSGRLHLGLSSLGIPCPGKEDDGLSRYDPGTCPWFWTCPTACRFPGLRVSYSAGFVDLKNVNWVILWRSYEKAVDPLGSILEILAFLIRHIIQTKMGWRQIKGGRILSPWRSQCLSSSYLHNTDNIPLDSKPDF